MSGRLVVHIRPTRTGSWRVQLDDSDAVLSEHRSETAAEQAAREVIDRSGREGRIEIRDRYLRHHDAPGAERPSVKTTTQDP